MPNDENSTPDPSIERERRQEPSPDISWLPPQASRLVLHCLEDRTVVFAVGPDGTVVGHVHPRGRAEMAASVAALRLAMGTSDERRGMAVRGANREVTVSDAPRRDAGPLLRGLYRDLVAPVEHALPEGVPLLIEPHGPLWLVPFAALPDAHGRCLVDRCPLLHAPSLDVLYEIANRPQAGAPGSLRALLVGDPTPLAPQSHGDLEIVLAPLPGARAEATEIAELLPGRALLLLGDAASLDRVEEEIPGHAILHFATHGVAWPDDPLGSFLALSDGALTVRGFLERARSRASVKEPEAAETTATRARGVTDLVVLSACQTGLGQITGDGVIGLTRAFLIAGARSVIVSLWSVDDDATRALMVAFYRHYLELGNKAVALQRAMLEVRGVDGWGEARFWAPFVLVGAAR